MRLEKLSKEKAGNEEEHAQEIEGVITKLKSNSAEHIQEVKIKMAEDMEKGYIGSWNVAGCSDALSKLTGKKINVIKYVMRQVEQKNEGENKEEEKNEEAKATPAGGDQTWRVFRLDKLKNNF